MSEEEKEAIEELKKQYRLSTNVDCITTDIRNEYARIILNLIEKQQKELNQEKEKNNDLKENYIEKSKVKEKIEENKWASEGYDSDTADYGQSQAIGAYIALIELLQEGDDK